MRHIYLIIIFSFCIIHFSIGQVGISNTDPKATLDISASNSATPSNTDGILIPRIESFPLTNPGADQNGMLVFLTSDSKFYYWHQGSTSWFPMTSDIEWTDNGTYLSPADGNSEDITIGGTNNTNARLTVRSDKPITSLLTNSGTQDVLMYGVNTYLTNNSNQVNSFTIGNYNDVVNNGAGLAFGDYNRVIGTGTGTHYGEFNLLSATGSGTHYGNQTVLSGSGSGTQYGLDNTINNTGNGDHTGVSNNLSGAGSGAQTGVRNNINNSENSLHTGVWNSINGAGNGPHFAIYNTLSGNGSGIHYGTYNTLTGTANGNKYGSYNSIATSAGGTHYGIYSDVRKSGSYAGYFLGKVSIGTTASNNYYLPESRGTNGQILQTDGSGNLNWVNSSTVGSQKINDLSDGKSDNDGSQNGSSIFLGINAGNVDDSTNNYNVGLGYFAMSSNTNGERNSAIGTFALSSNIGGDSNTTVGFNSLLLNETGDANVAVGDNSLGGNKTGGFNTSIGYYALSANDDGANNISIGNQSLFANSSGNKNVGVGSFSLLVNETGTKNLALGHKAGNNLTSGNNNIIIGGNELSFPLATGSNQLNIGNLIYGTGLSGTNNSISPGKIGIGVKTPSEKLEVDGAVKIGTSTSTNSGTIRWTGSDFEGYNGSVWKSFTINPTDTSPAWYDEGTTTNATTTTSDIIRNGNIGLGVTNATTKLDILDDRGMTSINITTDDTSVFSNADSYGIRMNLDNDNNGLATGDTYAIENTVEVLTGTGYGIKNNLISNSGGSPTVYGSYQNIQGNALGSAIGYGTYNIVDGNFFTSYGSYNRIIGAGYGVYSSATNTSAFAGYFLGRFSIGTTSSNNYIMPTSRGTNGQVIHTDGAGNLSWVDTNSFGIQKIDELSDGKSDTAGSSVFLGVSSGNVDDGSDNRNIGLGYHSLRVNTTGSNNAGLGHNTLLSNVSGNGNVAIGSGSLRANTVGYNTAIGYYSLNANTNGDNNIAVGNQALLNNSIGSENIGFGSFANQLNTTGSQNLAVGYSALSSNTTGSYNIALGYEAGGNLVTSGGNIPASNILIGNYSYAPNTSGSNQLNIGNLIYGTSVDGIGNTVSTGSIGIGVKVPLDKLHVSANIRLEGSVRMNHSSGNWWTTYVDSANDYNFGYNGILKSYILDTDGSYNIASDRNLKKSIQEMNSDIISKVMQLKPVTYTYKNDSTNRNQNGFIAQEVQKLFPELVSEKKNKQGASFLTLRYDAFGVLAIKTIQEQQKEIANLKEEISELKKLEDRIIALEKNN